MKHHTQALESQIRDKSPSKKSQLPQWILPGVLGAFLLTAPPAEAARLQSWQFEANQNRLSFRTIGGVQPRAQLLFNPTRLVIDLPGTTLGRQTVSESVGGPIREIRIGQFNSQTSRIVVELAEGYTLDPQKVQFRGLAANQWTVQLPNPEPEVNRRSGVSASAGSNTTSAAVTGAQTVLQDIQVEDEGVIFHTRGEQPKVELRPSSDRSWVALDLEGVTLSPQVQRRIMQIDRWGVERLEISQASDSPPLTRAILILNDRDRNLQAQVGPRGEVIVWPEGEKPPTANAAPVSGLATINSIELGANGSEVVVNGDRPLNYTTEWDRETLAYRVTIFSAQLGDSVRRIRPDRGSSVLWVRSTQEDPETVVVLVQPAAGVQVAGVAQSSAERISVKLQAGEMASVSSDVVPISVPDTTPSTTMPPAPNTPTPEIPAIPDGRMVIVIDPGHGGSDPGAVGIGGLQEKQVVLDISHQVSRILEENGIGVIMTRQDDRTIDLSPRTSLANRVDANLFVSIHANAVAGRRPEVNGLETYYYQSGRTMAQYIQNSMLQSFDMPNRGVKRARFYVLRHTRMPAVLVEVGFVTGNQDSRILADAAQRTRMAEAIARGILEYVRATR
ncbi:N-acetylmuramoyl-L-alanine amidase [Phormidium sp. CCY1219]|uniref:N-acetylmuramoyl-L-alanine amidase n=1 Tax=Phormidium sp. CCY1219 TaxID=2886104 RepID=UPI002D1F1DBB|nr:N-acetylmuramoyl-L-alanine amidase [Phormidium sp. CCY1219]MEB3830413.1 N-acetylmuramoyl-L-alanine amidase [Phormidium sp. CCY1219]